MMPPQRTRRFLHALKIRILDLEDEYDAITREMEVLAAQLDQLCAEAWDRHDRLVDFRALAFKIAAEQPPVSGREAA